MITKENLPNDVKDYCDFYIQKQETDGRESRKVTEAENREYTFDNMLNDIVAEFNESNLTDSKDRREYDSKLIVIQMLICLAESYKTDNYKDDETLESAIKAILNGNELLSGYMFYISQNPQFTYSWNYMRKRKANYKEFLINSIRFLNNVLVDINILASLRMVERNVHVIFHDIFDVEILDEKPFVKTRLLFEKFNRLATVRKEGYDIRILLKESLLKVSCSKKSSDMKVLIDSATELIKDNKKNRE